MKSKAVLIFIAVFSLNSFANSKPAPKPKPRKVIAAAASTAGPIDPWNVTGAAVGTFVGFGLGHPFQGRYLERGWIFTIGEAVSGFVWLANTFGDCMSDSCRNRHSTVGPVAGTVFIGLRIFEVVDLWTHLRDGDPDIVLLPSADDKCPLIALNWKF